METNPSPIFFPEDSTKIQFELAGLLARLAFCGLPKAPLNLPEGEKLTPKKKGGKSFSGIMLFKALSRASPLGRLVEL